MTTKQRIFVAVLLLTIPALLRFIFFYRGVYSNPNIPKPDYVQYTVPEPPTPSQKLQEPANTDSGKTILIDRFHGNMFEPSEIEPLVTNISAHGANVEFDTGAKSLELELKYASAYIIFSPSSAFTVDEVRIIREFVSSGGRLLVFSDPTRSVTVLDNQGNPSSIPDVNYVNPVIAPFGLTLVNDYLYNIEDNEGNFRNIKLTNFSETPLTKDLNMVVFYGAHSIHANANTTLAISDDATLSSLTDQGGGLSPIALSTNGQVLVTGDFSFITNPYNQVADNQLLLAHIADFAVAGERAPMLSNFPYLFQRPVSLKPTGDMQLTSSILGSIATLQKTLKAVNVPVKVRTEILKDSDTIILGTFSPSADLTPFILPFQVNLEDNADGLKIPGLGTISRTGSGVLLYNHGFKSNTLVLLAPDLEALPELINLVASGDLSACVLQENIAVCKLEDSSSSSDIFSFDQSATPTESTIPFPTPTASG